MGKLEKRMDLVMAALRLRTMTEAQLCQAIEGTHNPMLMHQYGIPGAEAILGRRMVMRELAWRETL